MGFRGSRVQIPPSRSCDAAAPPAFVPEEPLFVLWNAIVRGMLAARSSSGRPCSSRPPLASSRHSSMSVGLSPQARDGLRAASPAIVLLARVGYAAKGIVYIIIGVLAARV